MGLTARSPYAASRRASAALAAILMVLGLAGASVAASPRAVSTLPPTVTGTAVFDQVLTADPGTWEPADVTVAYRWLRDGAPIGHATSRTHRLGLADLGHRISVRVTGTDETGAASTATSEETQPVARATLRSTRPPRVAGVLRFTHTVRATPGRWSATPTRVHRQWYRGGHPIRGATGPRHHLVPADVGRRIRVRVTVGAPGYAPATQVSRRAGRVGHRVDVRRSVTYRVETRGRVTTSLAAFRRLAQETYADPRGWRGSGIRFRQVARGGSFTLVLAQADRVPGFSSGCSSAWSCRVGRYVIINQERWKHASPAWNAAHGALRDYRHMVVNHETGHWLGLGHAGCPGRGRLAPVMMQQSKGLAGCRFNPWPTAAEVAGRTPH